MRCPKAKASLPARPPGPKRQCANCKLREIHAAALSKYQLQLRDGQRENGDGGLDGLPLRFGEPLRGSYELRQAFDRSIYAAQLRQ